MSAPGVERTEWTTTELREDFEVLGFSMGFVVVRRRSDGATGSLSFKRVNDAKGEPVRVYFDWVAE